MNKLQANSIAKLMQQTHVQGYNTFLGFFVELINSECCFTSTTNEPSFCVKL